MSHYIALVILLAIVVPLAVYKLRMERDGSWHKYGQTTMRRRVNGRWVTRPISDTEYTKEFTDSAW